MTTGPRCAGLWPLMVSDDEEDQALAVEVCRRCPVAVRCLVAALERNEPAGVWGGTTPGDRRRLTAALRREIEPAGGPVKSAPPVDHGRPAAPPAARGGSQFGRSGRDSGDSRRRSSSPSS